MYRKIDFTTDYFDEHGRQFFRPATFGIIEFIKKQFFEGYKLEIENNFMALHLYYAPIFKRASWFQSEKIGEKKLFASLFYDAEKDKITLSKRYEEPQNPPELAVSELLFSCLRPGDLVEINRQETNENGKPCNAKYIATKNKISGQGTVKVFDNSPDLRFFHESMFLRKEFEIKKKGRAKNGKTTKIRKRYTL